MLYGAEHDPGRHYCRCDRCFRHSPILELTREPARHAFTELGWEISESGWRTWCVDCSRKARTPVQVHVRKPHPVDVAWAEAKRMMSTCSSA